MNDKIQEIRTKFRQEIGERMRMMRKKAGLSEEEVGKCLNVGKSTISRYEKGQLSIPAETLPVIAARCNQSPNRFFESEESIMEDCQILLNTMRDFFRHHKKNYENTEKQKEDSSKEVMDEFEFEPDESFDQRAEDLIITTYLYNRGELSLDLFQELVDAIQERDYEKEESVYRHYKM